MGVYGVVGVRGGRHGGCLRGGGGQGVVGV